MDDRKRPDTNVVRDPQSARQRSRSGRCTSAETAILACISAIGSSRIEVRRLALASGVTLALHAVAQAAGRDSDVGAGRPLRRLRRAPERTCAAARGRAHAPGQLRLSAAFRRARKRGHGEVAAVGRLLTAALVVVVAVLAFGVTGAQAAFPGANGRIAFTVAKVRLVTGDHPGYTQLVWSRIETVLPNGRGLRALRACPAAGCFDSTPAWSPSGRLLAFATAIQLPILGSQLTIIGQHGEGLRTVTTMYVGQPEVALAWSPDGRRLVFVAYTPPLYHSQLFTVGSDATGLQQITSGCGADEPTWSVKGTIAFRNGGCQQTGIYAIRPDGSRLRRLTDNRSPAFPDWSPDGSELAYTGEVSYGERQDIFIYNANGGGVRRLTRRGGAQPAWSPDGKYIAFIRNNDLYVMRRNGRGLRLLVRGPSSSTPNEWFVVSSPSWQPLPRRAKRAHSASVV